jgi:hypothetical protein
MRGVRTRLAIERLLLGQCGGENTATTSMDNKGIQETEN